MRSPNHYYYTGGSSLFKVFRLGIRLAIFVVAPLVLLSLGRTEGLVPRLKTPMKKAAKSGFSDVDIQYGISGSGELKRSVKYFNAFKPFFSAVIASE